MKWVLVVITPLSHFPEPCVKFLNAEKLGGCRFYSSR